MDDPLDFEAVEILNMPSFSQNGRVPQDRLKQLSLERKKDSALRMSA